MAMDGDALGLLINTARKAAMAEVPAVQTSDLGEALAYSDAVRLADSQAIGRTIVDYIVANSELVAKTSDTGPAGAGIITGSVK